MANTDEKITLELDRDQAALVAEALSQAQETLKKAGFHGRTFTRLGNIIANLERKMA